jgi:predicted transcriptional regulator
MSVTIPFPPEIEAKLRERAAASGKDVDAFIREAVEEKLGRSTAADKTAGQWTAEFDAWMREVAARAPSYPPGFVLDDSREKIYEGRGE